MWYQLKIQGNHYNLLKNHLFPGDGKEAVAVLLCGRHETEHSSILLSHKLLLIPYEECERDKKYVRWKVDRLLPFFEEVEKRNFALVKIHSHPDGYPKFSELDDVSDAIFFPAAFSWGETKSVHASLIMLPDGKIFGRVFTQDKKTYPLDKISIAGDDILVWEHRQSIFHDAFAQRTIQAFGEETYAKLKQLKVAVIGCSGTGSPTIEQLARLGVGTIVLIDPDRIEEKNLNRILNARSIDVGSPKVTVLARVINQMGLETKTITYDANLYDSKEALYELISCDVLFGCVDSVDGRHLLAQLANFYLIPYFDMGVKLESDGKGGISNIVGSVHYIQPGCSTLLSRGLYNVEMLRSANIKRTDPTFYDALVEDKYIRGVAVDRPAVISVTMQISSMAINEFLNRLHRFKEDTSFHYARIMLDYCCSCIETKAENKFDQDQHATKWAGRGDCRPFLRMPELEIDRQKEEMTK